MIDIESKIKFTEEDVEYIKNLANIFSVFDFSPWDVFEAVEDKRNLGDVAFKYKKKEK